MLDIAEKTYKELKEINVTHREERKNITSLDRSTNCKKQYIT